METQPNFTLKGDICYSKTKKSLALRPESYLVCIEGKSAGVFDRLPDAYSRLPLADYSGALIMPGLTDLHMHAPQYTFRALGIDMELLEWLENRAFPEEARYQDLDYAAKAYRILVEDLKKGPNTRICLFATVHVPATLLLMDMLEASVLVCMAGKVNMDRNSPVDLMEAGAEASAERTVEWLERCGAYQNCKPILTPRFIPVCSDQLMRRLAEIQQHYRLPLQSHLSENPREQAWVGELCPESRFYGDAYARFGLFGGGVPTIMAHCVWPCEEEIALLRDRGVFAAHCPQSNVNLSSGIAPARRLLEADVRMGLGSDVAGGAHASIFRAMTDAIQVSKLRQTLINRDEAALSLEEVFYLGTVGGGSFFGAAGSFEPGCDADVLVIDDRPLAAPRPLALRDRLERAVYLSDDRHIAAKYVRGRRIV